MTRTLHPALGRPTVWSTLLALTACAGTAQQVTQVESQGDAWPEGVLRAYVWQCTDGQAIVMRNLLPERAVTIALADGAHRLDQTVSASGVRYADADERIVFWTKGDSATLERAGSAVVACTERRAESLREDARLRGALTAP